MDWAVNISWAALTITALCVGIRLGRKLEAKDWEARVREMTRRIVLKDATRDYNEAQDKAAALHRERMRMRTEVEHGRDNDDSALL